MARFIGRIRCVIVKRLDEEVDFKFDDSYDT